MFLLIAVLLVVASLTIVANVGGDLSALVGSSGGTRRSLGRVPAWVAITYIGVYTVLCAGFGVLVIASAGARRPAGIESRASTTRADERRSGLPRAY